MPRKMFTQEQEEQNYNSLDSKVYRIHTLPHTIKDLEDGTVSSVSTPFGDVPIDIKLSGNKVVTQFFHDTKVVVETITLPSDNYGDLFGRGAGKCGTFLWYFRKYNVDGKLQLVINKKYYKNSYLQRKPAAKRKRSKSVDVTADLIGETERRTTRKPVCFAPNFDAASTSTYYAVDL